jgi:hypothetical protein
MSRGDLERLAYEASRQGLAQQEQVLNELRGRAGTLLAASSIVASFLGSRALQDGDIDALAIAALVAFVLSVVAALWILAPKRDLTFAISGPGLYEALFRFKVWDNTPEIHRRLAYWMQDAQAGNQKTITNLQRGYWVATAAVVAEVMLWTWRLTT